MEKFSRWSDLATGINPFVPAPRRFHRNFAAKIGQCALSTVLCGIRLPLLVVFVALLLVHAVLSTLLQYIPFLNRFFQRILDYLICSLLLLIFGVLIHEEPANLRRLGLMWASKFTPISSNRSHPPIHRPASKTKGSASTQSTQIQTSPKDLILCNHTNFFEILYLAKRFSPHFVIPIYDAKKESPSELLVKQCNLIQAIYQSLRVPHNGQRKASKSHSLTQILQNTSKPIVLFPEGARSNGQSVLAFLPVLQEPTRVHLMSFRYDSQYFSPSFSAGSAWKYLLKVSFAVYHSLHVTYLNADHLAHMEPQGLQQYRKLVASMLRTKGVDLNVEDFCSFNAYWDHISRGGKSSAATFTSRKAPHEHARWKES